MHRVAMGVIVGTLITLVSAIQALGAQDTVTFGDWLVGLQDGNDGLYAATVNASGLAMGEYCFTSSKKCMWLVATELKCDEGASYPALANTDAGAFSLELVCGDSKVGDRSVYIFSDWSQLEQAIRNGKQIGIAVAMPDNRFEVWRFSLNGMRDATAAMEKAFFSAAGTPPGTTNTSTEHL